MIKQQTVEAVPQWTSGGLGYRARDALNDRCRQLNHSRPRSFVRLDIDRNPSRSRKGIGNHLKFFPIKANPLARLVPEMLHTGTDLRDRKEFVIMAVHDALILPGADDLGKRRFTSFYISTSRMAVK